MTALPWRSNLSAHELFNHVARRVSAAVGSPIAFGLALLLILGWLLSGPIFGYSDSWQLVINTGTTIVTFLMVFLIQNTQNRDSRALHLKLDELIRSIEGARNELIDLEAATDEELDVLQKQFDRLHQRGGQGAGGVLEAITAVKERRGRR